MARDADRSSAMIAAKSRAKAESEAELSVGAGRLDWTVLLALVA
jgi:hypothetical protein